MAAAGGGSAQVMYEEVRRAVEPVPAAVATDLYAGNVRCAAIGSRVKPAVCPNPQPAPPNVMRPPKLRARDQGDPVRVGRDTDDQFRAWQSSDQCALMVAAEACPLARAGPCREATEPGRPRHGSLHSSGSTALHSSRHLSGND